MRSAPTEARSSRGRQHRRSGAVYAVELTRAGARKETLPGFEQADDRALLGIGRPPTQTRRTPTSRRGKNGSGNLLTGNRKGGGGDQTQRVDRKPGLVGVLDGGPGPPHDELSPGPDGLGAQHATAMKPAMAAVATPPSSGSCAATRGSDPWWARASAAIMPRSCLRVLKEQTAPDEKTAELGEKWRKPVPLSSRSRRGARPPRARPTTTWPPCASATCFTIARPSRIPAGRGQSGPVEAVEGVPRRASSRSRGRGRAPRPRPSRTPTSAAAAAGRLRGAVRAGSRRRALIVEGAPWDERFLEIGGEGDVGQVPPARSTASAAIRPQTHVLGLFFCCGRAAAPSTRRSARSSRRSARPRRRAAAPRSTRDNSFRARVLDVRPQAGQRRAQLAARRRPRAAAVRGSSPRAPRAWSSKLSRSRPSSSSLVTSIRSEVSRLGHRLGRLGQALSQARALPARRRDRAEPPPRCRRSRPGPGRA